MESGSGFTLPAGILATVGSSEAVRSRGGGSREQARRRCLSNVRIGMLVGYPLNFPRNPAVLLSPGSSLVSRSVFS